MQNRWIIADPVSEEEQSTFSDFHPVILQLLWNRGLRTQTEMQEFLVPDWQAHTHDPFVFSRMEEAVDRVFQAFEDGEQITVHGDYDADGVCGSTVLISTLREIAVALDLDPTNIDGFIPHREKEGYGVAVKTIETLASQGTTLLITVDCGISNKEAIDRGKELGVDTIVCDHHAMPKELPEAAILIHPQVPGEPYPNKVLCGTGVAFKLASALIHRAIEIGAEFPVGHEKWLLDLVAIATITDVVPVLGENRVLEQYGQIVLNKTRRTGLRKLITVSGGKFGSLDTFSIGFQIGPRINAAGRIEHANLALELFLEEDDARAEELAQQLNTINNERRKMSDAMTKEALEMVGEIGERKLLVVAKEGWAPGLVGLVAGKLSSKYGIPCYAVSIINDKHVGSGRSPDLFDVTKALHHAGEYLDKFGGHPQACGFSTTGAERFAKAVEMMEAFASDQLKDTDLRPELQIDAEIKLEDVDWGFYDRLQQLAPYGQKNPEPLFAAKGLNIIALDTVGAQSQHLRLTVGSPHGKLMKMIGFRLGDMAESLMLGDRIDVVFEVGLNEWNGNRELQLKLTDIRKV